MRLKKIAKLGGQKVQLKQRRGNTKILGKNLKMVKLQILNKFLMVKKIHIGERVEKVENKSQKVIFRGCWHEKDN